MLRDRVVVPDGPRKTTLLQGVLLGAVALAITPLDIILFLSKSGHSSGTSRWCSPPSKCIASALAGILVVRDVAYLKGTGSKVSAVAIAVVVWGVALGALVAIPIFYWLGLDGPDNGGHGARFN